MSRIQTKHKTKAHARVLAAILSAVMTASTIPFAQAVDLVNEAKADTSSVIPLSSLIATPETWEGGSSAVFLRKDDEGDYAVIEYSASDDASDGIIIKEDEAVAVAFEKVSEVSVTVADDTERIYVGKSGKAIDVSSEDQDGREIDVKEYVDESGVLYLLGDQDGVSIASLGLGNGSALGVLTDNAVNALNHPDDVPASDKDANDDAELVIDTTLESDEDSEIVIQDEPSAEPANESTEAPAEVNEGEPTGEAEAAETPSEPTEAVSEELSEISETPSELVEEPSEISVEEVEEIVEAEVKAEEPTGPVEEVSEAQSETPAVMPVFQAEQVVDGVRVKVSAEEGAFPEDVALSVSKVSAVTKLKVAKAVSEVETDEYEPVGGKNIAASYTYDIKVMDKDGNEIQPAEGKLVQVAFEVEHVGDINLDAQIYHVSEGEDGLKAQQLETTEDGGAVVAETDGFSYYTVEFTYGSLQYVLDGGETVPLSDILDQVGLTGVVTAVSVSNEELFSVRGEAGTWMVYSHQPFTSQEWMKVTIHDVEYTIKVTDAVTNPQYIYISNDTSNGGRNKKWAKFDGQGFNLHRIAYTENGTTTSRAVYCVQQYKNSSSNDSNFNYGMTLSWMNSNEANVGYSKSYYVAPWVLQFARGGAMGTLEDLERVYGTTFPAATQENTSWTKDEAWDINQIAAQAAVWAVCQAGTSAPSNVTSSPIKMVNQNASVIDVVALANRMAKSAYKLYVTHPALNSVSISEVSRTSSTVTYRVVVNGTNLFGGYNLTITGAPGITNVTHETTSVKNWNRTITSTGLTVTCKGTWESDYGRIFNGLDKFTFTVPRNATAQTITVTAESALKIVNANDVRFARSTRGRQSHTYMEGDATKAKKSTTASVPATPVGSIKVVKRDVSNDAKLSGCTFKLQQWSASASQYVDTGRTATTNSKGEATFSNLSYTTNNTGTFRVVETSAPTGYLADNKFYCAVNVATGSYNYASTLVSRVQGKFGTGTSKTVKATIKGKSKTILEVTKSGENFSGTVYLDDQRDTAPIAYVQITVGKYDLTTNASLSGTTFKLLEWSGTSAATDDGVYVDSGARLVTGSNGMAQTGYLPLYDNPGELCNFCKYAVTEAIAPNGYAYNYNTCSFTANSVQSKFYYRPGAHTTPIEQTKPWPYQRTDVTSPNPNACYYRDTTGDFHKANSVNNSHWFTANLKWADNPSGREVNIFRNGLKTETYNGKTVYYVNVNFYDLPETGFHISMNKRVLNETGDPLQGVKYSLEAHSGSGWVTSATYPNGITTDNAGTATFNDLDVNESDNGQFRIREISAPDGYDVDESFYVIVNAQDGSYTYHSDLVGTKTGSALTTTINADIPLKDGSGDTVNRPIISGSRGAAGDQLYSFNIYQDDAAETDQNLTVSKITTIDGAEWPVSGMTFMLQHLTSSSWEDVGVLVEGDPTDFPGVYKIPKTGDDWAYTMIMGDTYRVVERQAAAGVVNSGWVSDAFVWDPYLDLDINYTVEDSIPEGRIGVIKRDSETNALLSSATFTLKAKDAIVTTIGSDTHTWYNADQTISTQTTGDDGLVLWEHLPYGTYTVTETGFPADHAAQAVSFDVTIGAPTGYSGTNVYSDPQIGVANYPAAISVDTIGGVRYAVVQNPPVHPDAAVAKLTERTHNSSGTAVTFNSTTGRYTQTKVPGTYYNGQNAKFTITVTNRGDVDLYNLRLHDVISDELWTTVTKYTDRAPRITDVAWRQFNGSALALGAELVVNSTITSTLGNAVKVTDVSYYDEDVIDENIVNPPEGQTYDITFDHLAVGDSFKVQITYTLTNYDDICKVDLPNDVYLSTMYMSNSTEGPLNETPGSDTGDCHDSDALNVVALKVTKTVPNPAGSGDPWPVPGMTFVLQKQSGSTWTDTATLVEADPTNEPGVYRMPVSANGDWNPAMVAGSNYRIVERSAPSGVVNSGWISAVFQWTDTANATLHYTASNQIPLGAIGVQKMDSETGTPISGVEFTLTAKTDIVTTIGSNSYTWYHAGDVVGTAVTDPNGRILWDNLHYGNYTVTETGHPDNYFYEDVSFDVTVRDPDGYAGTTVSDVAKIGYVEYPAGTTVTTFSGNRYVVVENTPVHPDMAVAKLTERTRNPLEGAVAFDSTTGRYTQTKVPGTYSNNQNVKFTITASNTGTVDLYDVRLVDIMTSELWTTVTKYTDRAPRTTDVAWRRVNPISLALGSELAVGTVLTTTLNNAATVTGITYDDANKTYELVFDHLAVGDSVQVQITYTLFNYDNINKQNLPNDVYLYSNYMLNGTQGTKTPTPGGGVGDCYDQDKLNVVTTGSLTIHKKDADGDNLAGVEFKLYDTDNNPLAFVNSGGQYHATIQMPNGDWVMAADSGQTTTTTIVTNSNGTAQIVDIPLGTYTLVETKTAPGMSLLKDPITITLPLVKVGPELTVPSGVRNLYYDGANHLFDLTYTIKNDSPTLPQMGTPNLMPLTSFLGCAGICVLMILNRKKRWFE